MPACLLLVLTLVRLGVAAALPLSPDEAYYWVWSRALAPGYLDHPPMVALWIRAGTWIAGAGPLGVRLLAPPASAIGSLLLARAATDLLGRPGAGPVAALLLNATLVLGVGSVTITPDTPLLLFWTATLWALGRLVATGNGGWWLAAGAAAGLALDSKYTAILLAPSVLLWVVSVRGARRWLADLRFWAAALVAAALFAPVLAWNAEHRWASFARQGGRAADWRPARALQFLGELVAGQVGLATPLLAVLLALGSVTAARILLTGLRGRAAEHSGWALLACASLLPAAVFAQHALGDRVQANWPSVCYPAAAIAAAGLSGRWTAWRAPAVLLGAALTSVVWIEGVAAPLALPRALDPTLMRLGGWPALAADIADAARRRGAAYVAADSYGLAAILARALPRDIPVVGIDPRWALFRLPAAHIEGETGLLVRTARRQDAPSPREWRLAAPDGVLARARGGVTAERYRLYQVIAASPASPAGPAGPARLARPASPAAALLPRPR